MNRWECPIPCGFGTVAVQESAWGMNVNRAQRSSKLVSGQLPVDPSRNDNRRSILLWLIGCCVSRLASHSQA